MKIKLLLWVRGKLVTHGTLVMAGPAGDGIAARCRRMSGDCEAKVAVGNEVCYEADMLLC